MKIIEPYYEILTPINGKEALQTIEYCARTCYQSYDKQTDDSCFQFVKMLMGRNHESCLEHYSFSVKFIVDRGIHNEIVRHRLSSFCLSGDTEVYAFSKINKKTNNQLSCKSWKIKDLYNWQFDVKRKGRIKLINLRSVDASGIIVPNHIVKIFYNGVRDVFKVRTISGRELVCTKDHRLYTELGFISLENLKVGDFIFTNGRELLENEEWLRDYYLVKNHTRKEVAEKIGCCESLVYRSFKKFNIVKPFNVLPNRKGGKGRDKGSLSKEEIDKIKERSSGDKSNFWKPDRESLTLCGCYCEARRLYKKDVCYNCGSCSSLEIHHLDKNPRNNSKENIRTLCSACHHAYHYPKKVAVIKEEIVSIEYVGKEDVYDIQMENPNHNYVANGFVVHNCAESSRYVNYSKDKFGNEITVIRPVFFEKDTWEYNMWKKSVENAEATYMSMLERGVKPEEARSVLPLSIKTETVMTANLREWRHFFKLRTTSFCHPQMRQITIPLLQELKSLIPVVFDDIIVENT